MAITTTIRLNPFLENVFRVDTASPQYALLKQTIKEEGIREPLVLNQKNEIVDGYNIYHIALELGITEVPTVLMEFGSEEISRVWIVKTQFQRRNATPQQRQLAITVIKRSWARTKTLTTMELAEMLNVSSRTITEDSDSIYDKNEALINVGIPPEQMTNGVRLVAHPKTT